MKRIISILFVFISLVLMAASCQKAPFLTLNTPRSFTFTRDGGSQSITFTCNRDWSVSSSESWIQVSPSSGTASDGEVTVRITCSANTTYDPRSATVTIKVEELSEAVSISQDTGLGLIVSPKTFELTNAKQTIEIEVQKNVQYSVAIDNESSAWIKQGGTKALTTDKVTFTIEANTSYDNREGKITFKQLDGNLSETVTIKQAWSEGLIAEKTIYDVPYEGGSIDVNMSSNVAYDVVPGADWIHYAGTKALSASTVSLTIDSNETYIPREGTVTIKKKEGNLSTDITIKQAAMIAVQSVTIDKNELFLEMGGTAELTASISPSDATLQTVTWSSSDENVVTVDDAGIVKALKKGKATISAKAEEKEGTCLVYVDCIPDNEIWYTTINEQPLTFQSYNWGAMPEIISNVYSEGKVRMRLRSAPTEFTDNAFSSQYYLKTIILPETVTALGWGAFNECNNLESISLPDNLKAIGIKAFGVCEKLSEITLPDSVESVAEGVFSGCTSLQKINSRLVKADGRTIVMDGTLVAVAWAGLSSYAVPDGVKRIGREVFSHFSHMGSRTLKTVTFPNSLTTIGNMAFQEAPITSLAIPNSVETIEASAFMFCSDLATVTLPEGLKRLEEGVFDGCRSLSEIVLPDNLEYIGNVAFDYTALKTIVIPSKVTYIGRGAFSWCTSLESIHLQPLTPPTLGVDWSYSDPFVYSNCPIYVPAESLAAYLSADVWKDYYYSRIQALYTQPQAVDLGLSVKWASANLGANRPEDFGNYYSWGEVTPYDNNREYNGPGSDNGGKSVLAPENDAATVALGGKWRIPTHEEWEELSANCKFEWVTINGIEGYKVSGKKSGYESSSIFLPAAGFMSYGQFYPTSTVYSGGGNYGDYNTSSTKMKEFHFNKDYKESDSWGVNDGRSIRPVTD